MAGGAQAAYFLGKMGSKGGIKGAMSGMASVAEVGARAVTGKAMSSISAAGSSITKAHGSGVRKGLGEVSKGAKKAANPTDAGSDKAPPNWAKRASKRHAQNAGRHAAHSMRGNGSGSGSGPSLNPDG